MKYANIKDALNFILANPFDVHIVEAKAREVLAILDESEQASESQDELWNEVELLACEKRFIESNGPHCPEGFNIWHFITEVKSKFEIRRKQ